MEEIVSIAFSCCVITLFGCLTGFAFLQVQANV